MTVIKELDTGGIGYLQAFAGTSGWYWASDYASGDLYEAEELFRDGHPIDRNRLLLVSYPEGRVEEPIKAEAGQYFGRPAYFEGRIVLPLADFRQRTLRLPAFDCESGSLSELAVIDLSEVRDCYNLLLHTSPLMLSRQGGEGSFQIVWPERAEFAIGPHESFDFREGDRLYFARWYEDPDYREEVVVRRFPDGEIVDCFPGVIQTMPEGERWHLR